MPEKEHGVGRCSREKKCGLHREVSVQQLNEEFCIGSKPGSYLHVYTDSRRPHGLGCGSKDEAICTQAWGNPTEAPRPAVQFRVLSSLSLSQPPGSNPRSYRGVHPFKEADKGQEKRIDARGTLLASLSCERFLSICSLYPGRHPPKLTLWGRGQTAGQSVIRTHLVSGGSAQPQALSLAWHSYLIPH